MYVVTAELGYGGTSQNAKIDNGPFLKKIQTQSIDLDGDTIVDGWFYWSDASGYDSGRFTYEDTSIVYPWNTMFDSINIL